MMLSVALIVGGCVSRPEPTPEYEQLYRDLAAFGGLGKVSVSPIDVDTRRSEFTVEMAHGGLAETESLDALETYLVGKAPWFVFRRERNGTRHERHQVKR